MQITGITPQQFTDAVAKASVKYDGNLTAEITSVQSANRFRARVIPKMSSSAPKTPAPGARKSWNGRCLKAACWHAYRDAMYEVFAINPQARVYTAMATYKGIDGFESQYPATADQNIGSMMQPAYMPDLCNCEA